MTSNDRKIAVALVWAFVAGALAQATIEAVEGKSSALIEITQRLDATTAALHDVQGFIHDSSLCSDTIKEIMPKVRIREDQQ